ncbi:MAG: DEAD/DEAH box helicase, partial [Armatimonadota bacterium]
MNVSQLINNLIYSIDYKQQITHIHKIKKRGARYKKLKTPISGLLGEKLKEQGIHDLYLHQAEALEYAREGNSIVVVTATASGKTLCYNLPILESLEKNKNAKALYLYPTKALAQDQLGKLNGFNLPFVKAYTYDGDTPSKNRPHIRNQANMILTNPDMLHLSILPYHHLWSNFFQNLKYVVIDEVHSFKGVFGAHVSNIIKRLRRIAAYYGSNPQFICASATIGNPLELTKNLTGLDMKLIDKDGSPSGSKTFVLWNPQFLVDMECRTSPNVDCVKIFSYLIQNGIRTLVFTRARKTAELILMYTKRYLEDENSDLKDKIMSYRAGYTPEDRRKIEQMLFKGQLLGVTSTSALEVGIDIGGLDAVIITGYPGSLSSLWQQAGRSGRGRDESIAFLIAMDNPIDQYIISSPEYLFDSAKDKAIVSSENPYIVADHLLCASYELPLSNSEIEATFGKSSWDIVSTLSDKGYLEYKNKWIWNGRGYPASSVNIRSASNEIFDIISVEKGAKRLGTVDGLRAFETIHQGAVYLHAGESYIVRKFDLDEKVAYVEKTEVNYYTTPGSVTDISVDLVIQSRALGKTKVFTGEVTVRNQVTHYFKKRLFNDTVVERIDLDLPETILTTESMWFVIPDWLEKKIKLSNFDLAGAMNRLPLPQAPRSGPTRPRRLHRRRRP